MWEEGTEVQTPLAACTTVPTLRKPRRVGQPVIYSVENWPGQPPFQVGAFSTDIKDLGNGTVQYTMYNKADWTSLLGGINFGRGDHERAPVFPMAPMHRYGGNVRQMFQGIGPNPCN